FYAHLACGAGGIVDLERRAGEEKWLCDQLAAFERRVHRGKAVESQCVTATAGEEEGHLCGTCLMNTDGGVVRAVCPSFRPDAGTDEALRELAVVAVATARAHEQDVRGGAAFVHE
ncbi:MAG: hypothetical protein ACK56I_33825, partial [bacterium]